MCELTKRALSIKVMWKAFNLIEENCTMAGTKAGGLKAAQKNLAKDPNFYARIGAKGGKKGTTGGFAANPELARIAGAKGGKISRRTKKAPVDDAVAMQADTDAAA